MSELTELLVLGVIQHIVWPSTANEAPHLQMGYGFMSVLYRVGDVVLTLLQIKALT